MNSTSRQENERVEISLHKMRGDLEEVMHDVNTYQMRMNILEGKLHSDRDVVVAKDESLHSFRVSLEMLGEQISRFEKRLESIEKRQTAVQSDLKKLSNHANDTHQALIQYNEKIQGMEKSVSKQKQVLAQISTLKDQLSNLIGAEDSYTVRQGDTLGEIASMHNITIEALKKCNRLQGDRIRVGQKLTLPSK